MRHLPFIATAFCAALLASHATLATGNVLLPSSNSDASSAPNLGIAPQAAQDAAQPAPAVAPPTIASAPTQTPTSTSTSTGSVTTSPTQQAPMPTVNINDIISPVDEQSAKNLPAGALPTRIIHQSDNAGVLAQATANLPYVVAISISGRSVFGSNDVTEISTKLGLSRDQIASACYLSVSGLIQSDKGSGIVDGGLSPKITVRYDGTMQGSLLAGEALCTAGKLPPGSGFLNQIGNRYIIPLQPINCGAPTRQISQIIVNYDGTDKSSCSYQ